MIVMKHSVEKGDTLWSIAERYLGDGQRWKELFLMNAAIMTYRHEDNPDKIGPNFIFPNDEIFVVEDVEFEPSGN